MFKKKNCKKAKDLEQYESEGDKKKSEYENGKGKKAFLFFSNRTETWKLRRETERICYSFV